MEFYRSRSSDPITSHMAASSISEVAKAHYYLIMDCLKKHGPMGKDSIASHTNMNGFSDGNAVARRLPELQKMGFVKPTGQLVQSRSGRKEREWSYVIPKSLFDN